jgi:hypothetical protein
MANLHLQKGAILVNMRIMAFDLCIGHRGTGEGKRGKERERVRVGVRDGWRKEPNSSSEMYDRDV